MTYIVKLAGNTQAYLDISHDRVQDKHDVILMTYNYQNAVSFPAAWGYWKMEEASGTRVDSSGNGYNLGLFHPSYDPGNATGILGNCCYMNQNNEYGIYTSSGPTLSPTTYWTVTFWHKAGSYDNHDVPLQLEWGPSINVMEHTGDPQNAEVTVSDTEDLYINQTVTLNLANWHFYCIYYNGTGMYLEIDNTPIASAVGTCILSGSFNTGILNPYSSCYGYYDELRIGMQALTADQRTQLYNAGAGWSPY